MTRLHLVSLGLLGLIGCMYASAPEQDKAGSTAVEPGMLGGMGYAGDEEMEEGSYAADDLADGAMEPKPSARSAGPPPPPADPSPTPESTGDRGGDDGGAEVRDWFPESFLWAPLVQTDAAGTAMVEMKVPDQLTTWRVLALAHSAEGRQAGTVHTFDSRLPLYVDPVVPGWLYVGDSIDQPIQVVNTTDAAITAKLSVEASGALSGRGIGDLTLGAGDSDVHRIRLEAIGAGPATVKAELGSSDAAEKRIPVRPAGRPVEKNRGGTLASTRSFRLSGPDDADPLTEELSVLVFPGPLAVLQAEVERAGTGARTASSAAYGFALASRLVELSARADTELDPDAVRALRLLAWQRVVHHSRAPDAGTAADLLAAMDDVEGHELAERLKKRLVRVLVSGQRADGTWARQSTGSLQQVIVQTAFAARVLPEDETGARLRAAGALERYAREVDDAYTASVVLASGLVEGTVAEHLHEIAVKGIVTSGGDGSAGVSLPLGARNPWGRAPSRSEMLAWSSLAADPEGTTRGDLVSALMSRYDATWGFGAREADVIALDAVIAALPGLDREVEVVMKVAGREVARETLDPAQPRVPAMLTAQTRAADPQIELTVEPAVPGLAYVATLASWVPWTGEERMKGVESEVEVSDLTAGRDGTITVRLSAPSGVALTIEQGIPAGTAVDAASLEALSSVLTSHSIHTDRVVMTTRSFSAGEVIELPVGVRPAFSGSFSTLPLTVSRVGYSDETQIRPARWVVAPAPG